VAVEPFSNCTLPIVHVSPAVKAPTVNKICMPVVAAEGTLMLAEKFVTVALTVNVPVAIWVTVGLASVPKVSAVVVA
jgi:hypothetical protein